MLVHDIMLSIFNVSWSITVTAIGQGNIDDPSAEWYLARLELRINGFDSSWGWRVLGFCKSVIHKWCGLLESLGLQDSFNRDSRFTGWLSLYLAENCLDQWTVWVLKYEPFYSQTLVDLKLIYTTWAGHHLSNMAETHGSGGMHNLTEHKSELKFWSTCSELVWERESDTANQWFDTSAV